MSRARRTDHTRLDEAQIDELSADIDRVIDDFVNAEGLLAVMACKATILQLLCEKWGPATDGIDAEGAEEAENVPTRTPRHRAQVALRPLLEEWGIAGYDGDGVGLNDPLPSERVLARRIIDELDSEAIFLAAFRAGVKWMMSRGIEGAFYGVHRDDVHKGFKKYWLGR